MARSTLFIPGDRPERFDRALTAGADAVCLDLEDGVAPPRKELARHEVAAYLQGLGPTPCEVFVRVNALDTASGRADLDTLIHPWPALGGFVVPKAAGPDSVAPLVEALDRHGVDAALAALVENPQGLRRAHDIGAHPRVSALLLGPVDMVAALEATASPALLTPIRVQLRLAAAEAGKPVIDGPYPNLQDPDGLQAEAELAASFGYHGKLAIHPDQVPIINQAFTASPEQVERDRKIVAAADASPHGAVALDGRMIDKPVIDAARRRLAQGRKT